ncbi:Origin recognition complex subunit 6 (ORC6) [Metarhizium album ARSEF 1941]|uniref:Origin recognition complex subunit 6 (ORC6) n=1 Tax=Metarhizium album (strain ARSEF 1941) TaxID=1081103 RepID=A0A0B2WW66_METAS|nr:Origin recognition complex subunit 6 (ORC6) [Metarhizium album ARSEF 1941]KHN98278.1 Origin recognition complex subunit 6 (ORC6) [Metarhizium album ARSEF 1941]
MSRQIEQALLSLMPTYGSDLPPSLVELAASLLAQSRHRASTLKAEEEIARQYACSNIACDRLKMILDLPPIEPRPPIPPRIYKRLYTHLDNILPNPTTTPRSARKRTPSSKQRDHDTPSKSQTRRIPSRATPTKEAALAQFRASSKNASAPAKGNDLDAQGSSGYTHPWIQPVIRFMCAESDLKRLAPTVLAGMEHILTQEGRPTQDQWVIHHVTDLVAAVYFFVLMRVRSVASGAIIDREGYVPLRKEILALVAKANQEVTVPNVDESAAWEGWNDLKARDFDAAVAKVNENDWLSGDWYEGIVDVMSCTTRADADVSDNGAENSEAFLPTRRADTMLQERYDLLSEAKKSDYVAWRGTMLDKIAHATPAEVVMEIDSL